MESNLQKHINEEVANNIKQLYNHAQVANEEMGAIKNDIGWIKGWLEKLDLRIWIIITGIILSILTQIVFKLL